MPTKKVEYVWEEVVKLLAKDSEIENPELEIFDDDDDDVDTKTFEDYTFQIRTKDTIDEEDSDSDGEGYRVLLTILPTQTFFTMKPVLIAFSKVVFCLAIAQLIIIISTSQPFGDGEFDLNVIPNQEKIAQINTTILQLTIEHGLGDELFEELTALCKSQGFARLTDYKIELGEGLLQEIVKIQCDGSKILNVVRILYCPYEYDKWGDCTTTLVDRYEIQ